MFQEVSHVAYMIFYQNKVTTGCANVLKEAALKCETPQDLLQITNDN